MNPKPTGRLRGNDLVLSGGGILLVSPAPATFGTGGVARAHGGGSGGASDSTTPGQDGHSADNSPAAGGTTSDGAGARGVTGGLCAGAGCSSASAVGATGNQGGGGGEEKKLAIAKVIELAGVRGALAAGPSARGGMHGGMHDPESKKAARP